MAQLAEMAWQFGVVLILSQAVVASESSLILVSTYGACGTLALVFTSSRCGRAIDQGSDEEDRDTRAEEDRLGTMMPPPPRRTRWQTVRWFLVAENLAVLVATGACLILLQSNSATAASSSTASSSSRTGQLFSIDSWSMTCLVVIHAIGALAQVLYQTIVVAMERDWLVVLCQTAAAAQALSEKDNHNNNTAEEAGGRDGIWAPVSTRNKDEKGNDDDSIQGFRQDRGVDESVIFHQWLSRTNVAMKQINLVCKIAAPTLAGFAISVLSSSTKEGVENDGAANTKLDYQWACWAVAAITVISFLIEYACTAGVYLLVPALACRRDDDNFTEICAAPKSHAIQESRIIPRPLSTESDLLEDTSSHSERFWWLPQDLRVYFEQQSALGGLGFAVLNANPLTFGNGIMVAYLLSRGMSLPVVGSLRGLSALIGLFGTLAYHFSVKHQSVKSTCLWGISCQSICLGVSFISLVTIPNDAISLCFLVGGVCASRVGMWMYYIGITQMQQEQVPSAVRGQVGGTQEALNACFNLISFGLGIVYPDPKNFSIFVLTSFTSVTIAAFLYTKGVYAVKSNMNHY